MVHQAVVALEWFHAWGERTPARLRSLVAHFCDVGGIRGEAVELVYEEAARVARFAKQEENIHQLQPKENAE